MLEDDTQDAVTQMQATVGLPDGVLPPRSLFDQASAAQLLADLRDAQTRYAGILQRLVTREQHERVIVVIAREFTLDAATAAGLLIDELHHPDHPAESAVTALVDPSLTGSDPRTPPDRATCPAAFAVLRRVYKAAILCDRMGLTPDTLQALPAFDVLDLDDLPVEPPTAAAATMFDGWHRLATLARIAQRGPGAGAMLSAFAQALTSGSAMAVAHARNTVADALGIDLDTAADAAAALGLTDDDYRDPRRLVQLLDLLAAAQRTGGTPKQLATFAATPAADGARLARELARGKHGPTSGWRCFGHCRTH
jgi:hypothetical protein